MVRQAHHPEQSRKTNLISKIRNSKRWVTDKSPPQKKAGKLRYEKSGDLGDKNGEICLLKRCWCFGVNGYNFISHSE